MINLTGRRPWFFLISTIIIVPGIISMILFGFKTGLEFTGGTTMTVVFTHPVAQADLRQELTSLGHSEAVIQGTRKDGFTITTSKPLTPDTTKAMEDAISAQFGAPNVFFETTGANPGQSLNAIFAYVAAGQTQNNLSQALAKAGQGDAKITPIQTDAYLLKTRTIGQEPKKDVQGAVTGLSEKDQLAADLTSKFGPIAMFDFYSVSPIVASEVVRNAAIATVVACAAILIYMAWAFRKMPKPFRWGVSAVAGLVHNIVVMLGVFSILGWVLNVEVDAMFITAILTVVGYGINDTVVVFDRIRENVRRGISRDFEVTINQSLVETLGRSQITGMGAVFVLLALFLAGGPTLHTFVLALLIGVIDSHYGSIFISSQLLLVWETKNWGTWTGKVSPAKSEAKA